MNSYIVHEAKTQKNTEKKENKQTNKERRSMFTVRRTCTW